MADLTVTYDDNGPVALTSTELHDEIVAAATVISPGLTTTLPGSLIEDMASTATGAALSMDQMRIDMLNSIGPNNANLALLTLQAQQYGVAFQKTAGTTTVSVVFTGTPNYLIPAGFIVSDGTYQYSLDAPVTIPSTGVTASVTCTGTVTGQWAVAIGAVTTTITSYPSDITLSVTNPTAGVAGASAESNSQFRGRVWEAGMFTLLGQPTAIRTALNNVDNVTTRLTSVVQTSSGWIVLCAGGESTDMATAIFGSAGDITRLQGTSLNVTGITQANPGVVTTDITHGFSDGQVIQISGIIGMTALNGVNLTITKIDAHSFSIGVDTSGYPAWTSGGVVTPNLRNQSITILDWPDSYTIPYAIPLVQTVSVMFKWATQSINYLSDTLLLSLIQDDVISYVNSIYAGQPLNINKLKNIWDNGVQNTVDMTLFTSLEVSVVVNGVLTDPDTNTNIISGDPYSYWYMESNGVTVEGA